MMEETCFYGTFLNPQTKKDTWEYLDHDQSSLEQRISVIRAQANHLEQRRIKHQDVSLELINEEQGMSITIKSYHECQAKTIKLDPEEQEKVFIGKAYQATITMNGETLDEFSYLLTPIIDCAKN